MHLHSDRKFLDRRRELRNNTTPQERILWSYLKNKQLACKFQRQHSIGPYIVDFYCAQKRLVIEIDGSQHSQTENQQYDKLRADYLKSAGCEIIRFWNNEINTNIEGVLMKITSKLNE